MAIRITGYALLIAAAVLTGFVLYRDSSQSSKTSLIFSPSQTLAALWNEYTQNDLESDTGRTVDQSRGGITTSEGQSYTMLRAVWMGDKGTFDQSWQWTQTNLSRPDDHLFAWLWGQQPDGSYGVLTSQNGQNTASDADTDIALSLVFAYARWQDPQYLSAARSIIADIWNNEVLTVGGNSYVLADNLEKNSESTSALIDPSYLSPAAYRIFAQIDPAHPWMQAVSGAYRVIGQGSTASLGASESAGLPPDWIAINKKSGVFAAPSALSSDTNFSYDALRVPWELALDWQWFKDPRDKQLLQQFSFLSQEWRETGSLDAGYTHAGAVATDYDYQTPAMYGGTIGYFSVADPADASAVYDDKLAYLYMPDWSGWRQPLSYYDDNWAWFGIALYAGQLPNLTAGLPASFFNASNS